MGVEEQFRGRVAAALGDPARDGCLHGAGIELAGIRALESLERLTAEGEGQAAASLDDEQDGASAGDIAKEVA